MSYFFRISYFDLAFCLFYRTIDFQKIWLELISIEILENLFIEKNRDIIAVKNTQNNKKVRENKVNTN